MLIVGLDAGHGAGDRGAVHNGIVEAEWNMAFCRQVKTALDVWPFHPILIRTRDHEKLSFGERGSRSEECDLVFCIHVNAHKDDTMWGLLAFHWPGNEMGRKLGNLVARCAPTPLYKPGRDSFAATDHKYPKDDWLQRPRTVLGAHSPTSILIEVGYCSNLNDADALKSIYIRDSLVSMVKMAVLCYAEHKGV